MVKKGKRPSLSLASPAQRITSSRKKVEKQKRRVPKMEGHNEGKKLIAKKGKTSGNLRPKGN